MKDSVLLSKSSFLNGSQCHLRLWHDFHAQELADAPDEVQERTFDTGHEVGELACERYPGGRLIAHDHRHLEEALSETQALVDDPTVPALFEPAFEHRGLFARVDVLERLPKGGWRLIEVKSSTRLKAVHVLDVAFQLYLLQSFGLDVRGAAVMTLDRSYVYDGEQLDLGALFKLHHVDDEAELLLKSIPKHARKMQAVIASDAPPDIQPGEHCFEPYPCPYYAHCTRDMHLPVHGIGELYRLNSDARDELMSLGIEEIADIPDDFELSPLQQKVRTAVVEEKAQLHGDIGKAFSSLKSPVMHLDFETFAPAIPRFAGTRPYDAIPFLFSVHEEKADASPAHSDYLHEDDSDPREQVAKHLIKTLGRKGTICMYSSYERTVLKTLIQAVPKYAEALRGIQERLFDLLPVVRNSYYDPAFHGSFSLKSVLPVLTPETGYDDLEIADGRTAAVMYIAALATSDDREREEIYFNLRAYCERDTLATVKIRQALLTIGDRD